MLPVRLGSGEILVPATKAEQNDEPMQRLWIFVDGEIYEETFRTWEGSSP